MAKKVEWLSEEIINLRSTFGIAPFDLVCEILCRHFPNEIRRKAVEIGLYRETTVWADTIKQNKGYILQLCKENVDIIELGCMFPFSSMIDILAFIGADLQGELRGYIDGMQSGSVSPASWIKLSPSYERIRQVLRDWQYFTELEGREFNHRLLVAKLQEQCSNIEGGDIFMSIFIWFSEVMREAYKIESPAALCAEDYYKQFSLLNIAKEKTKDKQQNIKGSRQRKEIPDIQEQEVEQAGTVEQVTGDITVITVNADTVDDSVLEQESVSVLFVDSRRWTVAELGILVRNYEFMTTEQLKAVLPNWSDKEIQYKITQLKSMGINTMERLLQVTKQ